MPKITINLRTGSIGSAAAHVLVILVAQFGLPHLFEARPVSLQVVPVEMVSLDSFTAPREQAVVDPDQSPAMAAARPAPPPRPPAPPPEPEVAEAPEPPQTEEVALPKPVKQEKPKPKKPEPEKPKQAKPEAPKPPETAKAVPQSKPKPPEPRRDFANVLKDLEREETKRQKTDERARARKKDEEAPQQTVIADRASVSERERLKQMIRDQVEPCWSPPVGAREADDLAVVVHIIVGPGGRVRSASIVDAPMMAINTYFQAAADAARRAVLNPRCQPLRLPQEHYDLWKEIRFNFDPREMLG